MLPLAQHGRGSTCLLSVSHGCHVDSLAHLATTYPNLNPLHLHKIDDKAKATVAQTLKMNSAYRWPEYCAITGYRVERGTGG